MEPRWLDAEEQRTWRAYIAVSALLEDELDQQLQSEAGMPHLYYWILAALANSPEHRLRMTTLAERVKVTRSRLTYAVSRLAKDGWLRREDSPTDKRGQLAVLTDEGAAILARAAPGHVATVRAAIFDRLTPEQTRQFGDILEIILEGLHAGERARPADLPWRR